MEEKKFVTVGKGEDKHAIPVDYMEKSNPRKNAGLSQDEFNKLEKRYKELDKKEIKKPSEIKESIDILDKWQENYKYELNHEKNETSKKSIQMILKSIEKGKQQLKDWFNTSKNNPKFYNKEWKEYFDKHKEEFAINNCLYKLQTKRLELGNKY